MSFKRTLIATCALSALCAGSAAAQQIALEEIVVTARKTEERLQEVPLSITAFSSRDLTERGLNDLTDVSNFTPGFQFEKFNRFGVQGGGSRPVIRGQSQILGEANASIFIDGIQYSDSILSFPFDIVDRVEVIKGPQAALFGRATFAGAVNIVTKKGTNDFENKISGRVAEYDDYEINLMSRGPIVEDKVFYMVHGRYYDKGGQYRNTVTGDKVGQEESINFNASLEFRPSDAFTAVLSGGYGEDNDGGASVTLQERTENNCFLDIARQYYCGEVVEQNEVELNSDLWPDGTFGLDKDVVRLSAKLEYDLDGLTITSNTGYFASNSRYGFDADFTGAVAPLGGGFNRIAVGSRDEWSTELLIQTSSEERLRGLAGVYYYKSRFDFREDRLNGSTNDSGEARVDNWAVFSKIDFDITERITASGELRYAEDKIGNDNPARVANPFVESTFKSWSPRFTVDWQVNDESLVYSSVAKGNKPGFINAAQGIPPEFLAASEEKSWNYEIGTKNTLLDGRMTLNAALYYIDWTNQQLTTNVILANGLPQSAVVNAGETKVEGFEIEMTNAFTDHFTGGFGYNLSDAKFKVFDDPEYGTFFGNPSVAGNQTPNSSKHQFNLFGRYSYPVADGIDAFLRGDFSYAERKYAQIFNLAHTGDQKLLNVKVGLEADDWLVTLFVNNVTDDRTPTSVVRYVDFQNFLPVGTSERTSGFVRGFQVPLADRRQFGVSASYNF